MTLIQPPQATGLADVADTIIGLLERGLVREAEVSVASLALWLLDRVETGRTSRDEADEVFATIDAQLTDALAAPTSVTFRYLLTEGEHFHHFGQKWGTEPTGLRELAYAILEGRAPAAPAPARPSG